SAYDEPGYAAQEFDGGYGNYGDHAGYAGHDEYADQGDYDDYDDYDETAETGERLRRRHGDDPARHAYYPGRRMNLGVVLLPLRIFLGLLSCYAGMSMLCDPVYFDDGARG